MEEMAQAGKEQLVTAGSWRGKLMDSARTYETRMAWLELQRNGRTAGFLYYYIQRALMRHGWLDYRFYKERTFSS